MNIVAAAILLIAVQGRNAEQPETINDGIEMKEIDIKAKIRQALESCDWSKAQELIAQAEPDIEIINMTEAALRNRQIQQSENLVSLALLQQVQLRYTKAAYYWEKAALDLPDDMEERKSELRARRDKALVDQEELDKSRLK